MNMMSTAQASKSRSFGISQRRFLRLAGAFFWVATGSSSERRSEANTGAQVAKVGTLHSSSLSLSAVWPAHSVHRFPLPQAGEGTLSLVQSENGELVLNAKATPLPNLSFNVITADGGVIGKTHDKGRVFFGLEDLRCRECGGSGDDVTGCV